MADKDKASPEEAGATRLPTPPDQVTGDARFLFVQEAFEIAQTLGRVQERLDSHSQKLNQIDEAVQGLSEKVDHISREFGYIKRAWWIAIFLLGIAFKEVYELVIKPVFD